MGTDEEGEQGGLDQPRTSKRVLIGVDLFLYAVGVVLGLAIVPLFADPGGLAGSMLVFVVFPSVLEIPFWMAVRKGHAGQ